MEARHDMAHPPAAAAAAHAAAAPPAAAALRWLTSLPYRIQDPGQGWVFFKDPGLK